MYEGIFRGLFRSRGLGREGEQSNYLSSLSCQLAQLREQYTKFPVQVDYTNQDVQAAYLLAYYPHYTQFVYEVFSRHPELSIPTHLSVFGAGPCPELVGLLRYVRDEEVQTIGRLRLDMYDQPAPVWSWGRTIVFRDVVSNLCNETNIRLTRRSLEFDLTPPLQCIDVGDFLLFQNCLNEIGNCFWEDWSWQLLDYYEDLCLGGAICVIHVGEHDDGNPRVERLMDQVASDLRESFPGCQVEGDFGRYAKTVDSPFCEPPEILRKHFFVNGQHCRQRLTFRYLLAKRGEHPRQ